MNIKINNILVDNLGECKLDSPFLDQSSVYFIQDKDSVLSQVHKAEIFESIEPTGKGLDFFELAGPRRKIYFNSDITCGIVTCGGLCPGINDVIRGVVKELCERYGIKKVLGFKYGYKGLSISGSLEYPPMELNPDNVDDIHSRGGTILSSSRGFPDIDEIVETLVKNKIKILFTIGGDGTIRGASDIANYVKQKGLDISIIAIPKTIDNDISCVEKSFGFETAVQETSRVIESAHIEAKGAPNGLGLIKIMGRESGYISAYSSLANANVNFCLIPELKLRLDGENGFLNTLKKRMASKKHAVVLVSEGAGQDILNANNQSVGYDASGNIKLKDIGIFLKNKIEEYFKSINMEINIKYFDPSYLIRSVPANAMDSAYCLILAQSAVHAGMAGKTNMLVSYYNNHYVYMPIDMVKKNKKRVKPNGRLWHNVMDSTLQPRSIFMD